METDQKTDPAATAAATATATAISPLLVLLDENSNGTATATATTKKRGVVMVRVYLVRHGETDWNAEGRIQGGGYDVPLNANGRDQAQKAAVVLAGIPLDVVASSSLSRAKETADIVFAEHQQQQRKKNRQPQQDAIAAAAVPLRIVDEGFNEMRFGEFEGFRFKKRTAKTNKRERQTVSAKRNGSTTTETKDKNEDTPEEASDPKLERLLAAKRRVAKDPSYRFPCGGFGNDAPPPCSGGTESSSYRVVADASTGESNRGGGGECTRDVETRSVAALSRAVVAALGGSSSSSSRPENKGGGGASVVATTKHVAIVAHGRTNKILIAAMICGDAHSGFQNVSQTNGAISVLDHKGLVLSGGDGDEDEPCRRGQSTGRREDPDHAGPSDARPPPLPLAVSGGWRVRLLNYNDHVTESEDEAVRS